MPPASHWPSVLISSILNDFLEAVARHLLFCDIHRPNLDLNAASAGILQSTDEATALGGVGPKYCLACEDAWQDSNDMTARKLQAGVQH